MQEQESLQEYAHPAMYFYLAVPDMLSSYEHNRHKNVNMCFRIFLGEHQYELMDLVAAKFHEEAGVFKLLVRIVRLNV